MKTKVLSVIAAASLAMTSFVSLAITANATIETVTDTLTADDFAATSTSYKDFSGVQKNTAVYAGLSAKNGENIQLKSKDNISGIVSTTSGGTVKSVKINVGSGSKTVDVYGSNTAYTSAADLYDSSKQGTRIGSVSSTGTVSFSTDYAYVGIRSYSGAIYLSSVEITWETESGEPDPEASINIVNKDAYIEGGKGYIRYITELTFDPSMTVDSFGTWFVPSDLLDAENYATVQYNGTDITSGQTYTADLLGIPGTELNRSIVGISFVNFAGATETMTTNATASVNSIITGGIE